MEEKEEKEESEDENGDDEEYEPYYKEEKLGRKMKRSLITRFRGGNSSCFFWLVLAFIYYLRRCGVLVCHTAFFFAEASTSDKSRLTYSSTVSDIQYQYWFFLSHFLYTVMATSRCLA